MRNVLFRVVVYDVYVSETRVLKLPNDYVVTHGKMIESSLSDDND